MQKYGLFLVPVNFASILEDEDQMLKGDPSHTMLAVFFYVPGSLISFFFSPVKFSVDILFECLIYFSVF